MSDQNMNEAAGAPAGGSEKPGAVKAIGILNIIFGAFGIVNGLGRIGCSVGCRSLSGLAAAELGADVPMKALNSAMNMQILFSVLGFAVSVLLLIAGILLVKEKKKAISINLVYVIASIVVQVASIIVINSIMSGVKTMLLDSGVGGREMEAVISGMGMGFTMVLGGLLGIAYPVLVLLLVVINKKVKAYLEKAGT
jgi:hypothetical protein